MHVFVADAVGLSHCVFGKSFCFLFVGVGVGLLPRFVWFAVFQAKRKSCRGICGSSWFVVVFLFFGFVIGFAV